MADDGDDEDADADGEAEEPAVELGDGEPVAGAPPARVAARLTWGIERSEVRRKEGDTEIRTPDGPRTLSSVLDAVDTPYFERRQEFLADVRDVIGRAPVQTGDSDGGE